MNPRIKKKSRKQLCWWVFIQIYCYKKILYKNFRFQVGKGITYDTGGADIKAGGIMAGMSRDKCGAADVAG